MQLNISQKLEKLKENWPQKIFSLIVAIMLYAFYQISQLDTKTLSIPLQIRANGSFVQNSELPRNARITLKGQSKDISQLDVSDFIAYVDCSYLNTIGNIDLPLKLEFSERATAIKTLEIQIQPQKVNVDIQKREIKNVPIVPDIQGILKEGYEVASVISEPAYVQISGSSSIVSLIDSFTTELIDINGIDTNLEKRVSVLNKNKLITLEIGTLPTVTIVVKESIKKSTFNSVPVKLVNVNEQFIVESNIKAASITVEGTYNQLKNYRIPSWYTGTVDCSSISEEGTYVLPIKFSNLGNLAIKDVSIEEVTLTVTKVLDEEQNSTFEDIIEEN